jgi:glycosyltransferase involved in cell wall biosynthesis
MRSETLSIVVPMFNEAPTIGTLLERVAAAPLPEAMARLEIVVVDDASTDDSLARARAFVPTPRSDGVDVVTRVEGRPHNRGKGAALRVGFALTSGDVVLVQDADLEYDPKEYPNLLAPILDGNADVVYGSRFLGGPHRVLFFWHYLGNRFLTLLSNMLTDLNLTDMETCYKVFRGEVIRDLVLTSDRFGFEPEVTAKVARRGCRVYEVPISYHGRTYAEGKKIGWRDGVEAVWSILKYNLWRG